MGEPVVGVDDLGPLLADHTPQVADRERIGPRGRVAALFVGRPPGDAVDRALQQPERDPVVAIGRLAGRLAHGRDRHLVAAPGQLGAQVLDDPLLAADHGREGLRQHQNPHLSFPAMSHQRYETGVLIA